MTETKVSKNPYDSEDIVRQVYLARIAGYKFASFQVRNMAARRGDYDEFGLLQHHMTLDNTVGATLTDVQAQFLAKQLAYIKLHPEEVEGNYYSAYRPSLELTVDIYRRASGILEVQIRTSTNVLGVMPVSLADIFCLMAREAARWCLATPAVESAQA
jgi:hypothetical protein